MIETPLRTSFTPGQSCSGSTSFKSSHLFSSWRLLFGALCVQETGSMSTWFIPALSNKDDFSCNRTLLSSAVWDHFSETLRFLDPDQVDCGAHKTKLLLSFQLLQENFKLLGLNDAFYTDLNLFTQSVLMFHGFSSPWKTEIQSVGLVLKS